MNEIKSSDSYIIAKGGRNKATFIGNRAYTEIELRLIDALNSEMEKALAAGIDIAQAQMKIDAIIDADEYDYIQEMLERLNNE